MLDPDRYFPIDPKQLTFRLIEVTHQLIQAHRELHTVMTEERRLRFQAFQRTVETSVAGKERAADIETYSTWVAVQDVKVNIQDLTEEKELIRFLLEMDVNGG